MCVIENFLLLWDAISDIFGTFTSNDSIGWTYELNPAILVIETYDDQI